MNSKNRRWRLLAHPKFQLILISVNFFNLILAMLVVKLQVVSGYHQIQNFLGGVEAQSPEALAQYIDQQASFLDLKLLAAFSALTLLSSAIMLVASHQIVGPLVRVKQFFQKLAEGETELPPLQLRKTDIFQDFAPVINQALEKLGYWKD